MSSLTWDIQNSCRFLCPLGACEIVLVAGYMNETFSIPLRLREEKQDTMNIETDAGIALILHISSHMKSSDSKSNASQYVRAGFSLSYLPPKHKITQIQPHQSQQTQREQQRMSQ